MAFLVCSSGVTQRRRRYTSGSSSGDEVDVPGGASVHFVGCRVCA